VQLLMLQLSIAAAGIAPIVTLWLRCFSRLHKHSPQNTQIRAGVELLHLHLHVASALLADTARQGLPLVASLLAAYSSGWQHHSPGLSCCVWHVLSPRKTYCGLCIVDYVTPLHRHDQGQRADCQIDDSLRVRLSCQLRAEPAACGTVCVYHTGCVTLTTRLRATGAFDGDACMRPLARLACAGMHAWTAQSEFQESLSGPLLVKRCIEV
jgi:hypothetical protein